MKIFLSITSLLLVFLASGCGYREGVQTEAPVSYLYFKGDVSDVRVSVDDAAEFDIKPGEQNQYAITPGKHIIKIYRGSAILVTREVYIGDGVAIEIEVK